MSGKFICWASIVPLSSSFASLNHLKLSKVLLFALVNLEVGDGEKVGDVTRT